MASSALSSVGTPETDKAPAGLNEPSMEDILASIRRIIAEDQSNSLGRSGLGSLTRRAAAAAAPAAQAGPDPIAAAETARSVEIEPARDDAPVPLPPVKQDPPPQGHRAPAFTDHKPAIQPVASSTPAVQQTVEANPTPVASAPITAEPTSPPPGATSEEVPLISPSAGDSITSSFHALAETVLLQDPDMVERVTRDVLRPMLKTWLDDNLPSIVERLVRAEIERVARGGRGRD